jgi:hypothetical protein
VALSHLASIRLPFNSFGETLDAPAQMDDVL